MTHSEDEMEATTRCPACGTIGYGNDRFCACCGEPMARICSNCGSRILQPIANYCTQCGAPLVRYPDEE